MKESTFTNKQVNTAMFKVYDMYKRMAGDDIILAFKGNITEDLLSSVFQIMESRLEKNSTEVRLKKKVNNILVECLQNMYHHMEDFKEVEKPDDYAGSAMFLICEDDQNHYRIITGNYIQNSNVSKLKNKIDELNDMTPEQLKTLYQESLSNTELSKKGGAGLGLIDMARKSGHQINYSFDPVNDHISFFSQVLTID